jgi:hypothetical protein
VGKLLVDLEVLGDVREASVLLDRDEDASQLRFVVNPSGAADPKVLAAFATIGRVIAEKALGGQPVVVHLCDADLRSMKSERVIVTGTFDSAPAPMR